MTARDDADILAGWLTTDQACELTGYNLAHLERLAKAGNVKARKVGRSWLVDRESLLAWQRSAKPGRKPKN
jgi:excisionase family DNA binding protein